MEKMLMIAIITTFLFCLVKLLQMKFIEKEMRPLKDLVRDALMVFIASFTGYYLYFKMDGSVSDFFHAVTETNVINPMNTEIFTDKPDF
jgi:multisubunit Na+/H+ antiporter MnhB subunit